MREGFRFVCDVLDVFRVWKGMERVSRSIATKAAILHSLVYHELEIL